MLKLTIIGNLGADAEVHNENGQKFVSLSIAHSERRKQNDGTEKEITEWISATLNGDGGNLLPYLKKGTKVFAYGDCATRLFHSEKDRMMKAGLRLFIRNIELIGAQPDAVPRDLYSVDGIAHRVNKYYYAETAKGECLVDRAGNHYLVNADGWVFPEQPAAQTQAQLETAQDSAQATSESDTDETLDSGKKKDRKQKNDKDEVF